MSDAAQKARHYVVYLLKLTDAGGQQVPSLPELMSEIEDVFRTEGGEMLACLVTLGEYDLVLAGWLPDESVAGLLALWLADRGVFKAQTMSALDRDQVIKMLHKPEWGRHHQ